MPLNYEAIMAHRPADIPVDYGPRECMLYALGIGLGMDPMDKDQLRFVYERADLIAFPTLPTVLGWPGRLRGAEFGIDERLVVEWLKQQSGADITHVPYKGAADAMLAFTADDIQLLYLIVGNMDLVRQVNEGEVKGLLVPGTERSALIPKVPSFAEVGLNSDAAQYQTWFGMFAPKGTPRAVVDKLNAEFAAILHAKDFVAQNLTPRGFRPAGDSPADFTKFIVADAKRGKMLVEESGVKLDK